MRKLPRHIHVVWAPNAGPLVAYANPELAHAHARTMVGVDVGSVEVRETLPENVREDIASDYFDDDEFTPVDAEAIARIMRIPKPREEYDDREPPIAYADTDEVTRVDLEDVDDGFEER